MKLLKLMVLGLVLSGCGSNGNDEVADEMADHTKDCTGVFDVLVNFKDSTLCGKTGEYCLTEDMDLNYFIDGVLQADDSCEAEEISAIFDLL